MNTNANSQAEFVTYDDNNINHVLAGPNYGQPWGDGWDEESSLEFQLSERYTFNNFKFIVTIRT